MRRTPAEIQSEIDAAEWNLQQATAEAQRQVDLAQSLQTDIAALSGELRQAEENIATEKAEMNVTLRYYGLPEHP